MARSKSCKYRSAVRLFLLKSHKWKPLKASQWVTHHKEFIEQMRQHGFTASKTAKEIHEHELTLVK